MARAGADHRDHMIVDLGTGAGDVRVRVWPAADGAAGRPVLLAHHGWSDSGEVFGPLATALGRRWTVVAPDAPGHGGTPSPPQSRYRLAEHAPRAVAVLDRLPQVAGRRAPVVVLGHSMGGVTAARVAGARPGAVSHLVLEDPVRAALRRPAGSVALRAWTARVRLLDEAALVAEGRAQVPPWPEDELGPWARSKREMAAWPTQVPLEWGEPLVALLAEVTAPVTLVHGRVSRGGLVSSVAARRCAAACRGGCEVVPLDCGHNPRRERREAFIAVLASVLGRYER